MGPTGFSIFPMLLFGLTLNESHPWIFQLGMLLTKLTYLCGSNKAIEFLVIIISCRLFSAIIIISYLYWTLLLQVTRSWDQMCIDADSAVALTVLPRVRQIPSKRKTSTASNGTTQALYEVEDALLAKTAGLYLILRHCQPEQNAHGDWAVPAKTG